MTEALRPQEVGKTEKKAFRTKVVSLTINPSIFHGVCSTPYKKGDIEVDIMMPEPGYVSNAPEGDKFQAVVKRPLFTMDDGKRVVKEEELIFFPSDEVFWYKETHIVYDVDGKEVPSTRPAIPTESGFEELDDAEYIEARLRELKSLVAADEVLGTRVVNPERYHSVMSVLNSLTPEDVVTE